MPFGLHNAPATWQRLIDNILGDLEPYVFVYLDDVIICTQTFQKHLEVLNDVFRRLRRSHLTVSIEKCHFCKSKMKYLGYVVDRRGLHVDPEKVKAMIELPPPKSVREVRRIIGTFSWYRRFVPDFSSLVAPITALLKKSSRFKWTDDCDMAFKKVKELLIRAPVLNCPDYSLPFVIQTDASGYGIGAVLVQPHPDGDRVICFLSRSLTRQERNFTTTERECLAVLWSIEKLRCYIEGIRFKVITDHYSLVWLQNLKEPTGRLARWAVRLQQFDFVIEHRKGKDNIVPDMLSRAVPVLDELDERDISTMAKEDRWYGKMLKVVQDTPLKFPSWRVISGRLFKHVKSDFPYLGHPSDNWKLVIPKAERQQKIREAHDPPLSGHCGIYKTFSRVASKFYWPKMRSDVATYVRNCYICAAFKPSQQPVDGLASHPKPSRPWEVVSSDIIGPLPRSSKGHSFILVVCDYLTKFPIVIPLRQATSSAVVREIEEKIFLLFGVPRVLICDNGAQYRSRVFRNLLESYHVTLKYTPFYHARANPAERINRSLKTMLGIYASQCQRKWDVELQKIACAVRTSKHEILGLTPFFVMFGRSICLSGKDYDHSIVQDSEEENITGANTRNEQFRTMFEIVRRRLENAGNRAAQTYNLRHRGEQFLPGQPVWRRNYILSDASKGFSSKLAPKYIGPFYIQKRISPWTYTLKDDRGKVLQGCWHAKDLKKGPEKVVDN